ncbi:helix-turn-helix domain-containing protein [Flavobacterium pectinovorum]|uniref:helix-turn-helix domain-containing protein n=1 Tax=Flavobacterium pectinovorum TaxID=29533 RepID=UPI001FAB7040|nr:helix-turn-helix domain-containing protein [Flavobacterium pectinovorum]MCI9843746.1 AraC family transcriptional regulator [Flavobacterium pectinovorum]
MKFDKHFPTERLRPYIKYFVVSENELENEYKVFPSSGLVIGFQYKGKLANIKDNAINELSSSGITGITDGYKIFKNSADIGTILIFFTEIGFTHFASHPANELFNLSLSLHDIFDKNSVSEVEEKLSTATSEKSRVGIVEKFLLSQLKDIETDKLIVEAVKLIYQTNGTIRIKELNEKLFISQSPFEKRFRKVVGTTAKKFASIVRFNTILDNLNKTKTLTEICYENNFFDQAHFIKDFKQFTGDTPENFKRFL